MTRHEQVVEFLLRQILDSLNRVNRKLGEVEKDVDQIEEDVDELLPEQAAVSATLVITPIP